METEPVTPDLPTPATHLRASPHPVYWVIAGCLLVIATCLVVRRGGDPLSQVALGQLPTTGGARGVFAFSGQLTKSTFGVYIVDTDNMTMWVYEYLQQKGCLRLAGARSWQYDRYLENHNVCDLPPDVVEKMIEEQREYRRRSAESKTP